MAEGSFGMGFLGAATCCFGLSSGAKDAVGIFVGSDVVTGGYAIAC
jgi:hypothetical protein